MANSNQPSSLLHVSHKEQQIIALPSAMLVVIDTAFKRTELVVKTAMRGFSTG